MKNSIIPEEKLLTVVVPVYNTAQYLRKCIESIIHQQYKSIDIILIDDGSTDESGEICDSFLHIDSRIRVFHRKNQGLVAARKLGVDLAKGDLITFVDSDDWIELDMYTQMMSAYMEFEPDLVTSGITIDNGNEVSYEIDQMPQGLYGYDVIQEKVVPCMMYDGRTGKRAITSAVWNKIYKVDMLKKTIMDINEGITYGEDAAVTYVYIAKASNIVILDHSWYHYVIHSNSMVRHYDINSYERIYQFYTYMKSSFLEMGLWGLMKVQVKEYTKTFLNVAARELFDFIEDPIYLFPFELIEKGSRVILYGAGKVGMSYKKSLIRSGYAKLQGWVDKNYRNLVTGQHLIEAPDILSNRDMDYIVIAVENKRIALEIQEFLETLGIEKNKIVWKLPLQLN